MNKIKRSSTEKVTWLKSFVSEGYFYYSTSTQEVSIFTLNNTNVVYFSKGEDEKALKDDEEAYIHEKSSTDDTDHSEDYHFDNDDHEPIYQPEDENMNTSPHEEL